MQKPYNMAMVTILEAAYPISFRHEDAALLGEHLRHRHSVDLIGMKRVGISNFLRFFLSHPQIAPTYINDNERHVFITVDLNDLVEREIVPFWTLMLKRIVDATETMDISSKEKRAIDTLFLKTIQTQDPFMAIDSVRQSLVKLVSFGFVPTLFLLRFDRIKDALAPAFFDNLHGLQEATHHKLSFVFTSYRRLDQLAPTVFPKAAVSTFAHPMYIKLANTQDTSIISETYEKRYNLTLSQTIKDALMDVVHGYVQFLQLSLIILHEHKDELPATAEALFDLLAHDERMYLQSEELWESLFEEEKQIVLKIVRNEPITEGDRQQGKYAWDTGFVVEDADGARLFSKLFKLYVEQLSDKPIGQTQSVHFSRKEHALMQILEKHVNEICERDEIITAVWPESEAFGISDWAIDRLVARVRVKLKQQNSKFEIKTIRTRGYQLVTAS
jgi:hypothetical protein